MNIARKSEGGQGPVWCYVSAILLIKTTLKCADFGGWVGGWRCQGIQFPCGKFIFLISHCKVYKANRPWILHTTHLTPSGKIKEPTEISESTCALLPITGCFHVMRVVVHIIMGSTLNCWKQFMSAYRTHNFIMFCDGILKQSIRVKIYNFLWVRTVI